MSESTGNYRHHHLGDPRKIDPPMTSYRHRVNYHPLQSWFSSKRIDRRRLLAAGGMSAFGFVGLLMVGCGDDEKEEPKPAAAEAPAAEVPAAEAPAAEAPPAQETPAPTEVTEEDLQVAQAALPVSFDSSYAVEHESQEASATEGSVLVRARYIKDPLGTEWQRQDVSLAPGSIEGELASEWSVSDDGLTYTFKLRDGLSSFAGNPFTVEDVLYTYQRGYALPGQVAFLGGFALAMPDIDPNRWQKVDDHTIKATIAYPYDTFILTQALVHQMQIVDSVLVKSKATADDPWAEAFTGNNTHGFGGFAVTHFEQGKEAIWEVNPGFYPYQRNGLPNFKRMIWRQVPDSSSRLALIQRGDVHIAKQMLVREQEEAEETANVTVPVFKTNYIVYGPLNVGYGPFKDKRVRQAFLHTIPYQDIINTVYKGRAQRAYGIVFDLVLAYHPEPYQKFDTDIDRAKELLAEAGLPDGFEMDFGYSLATPDMEENGILMRDSAAKAGIKINLKGLTPSELNDLHNARENGFPHLIRDYATVETAPYALRLFAGAPPNNFADWSGYGTLHADNFDKFDAAINRGVAVGDDTDPAAIAAFHEAQEIHADDAPWFWSVYVPQPAIYSSRLTGYAHHPNQTVPYYRLRFTS